MDPIYVEGLTKRYGETVAVDKLNLSVRKGDIYGFLGLNGAGKTTTIRALLGMIRTDEGKIFIEEHLVSQNRGPWSKVGHMVESVVAYPQLTVRENLEVICAWTQVSDRTAIDRVAAKLGLEPSLRKKARDLSLGNLQRLGFASALIHSPSILILDEPINGLDPAGVLEIRELLQNLAQNEGTTILMSSHLLEEVSKVATRIGIIHNGRMVKELSQSELSSLETKSLHVGVDRKENALATLEKAGYQFQIENGELVSRQRTAIEHPSQVNALLLSAGFSVSHLSLSKSDLEAEFFHTLGDRR